MFGVVPRDTAGKCLAVSDHLNVNGNVYVANNTIPNRRVITVPTLDNSGAPVSYTLVIDSSSSKIGDVVIVFFTVADILGEEATVIFPENLCVTEGTSPITSLDIHTFPRFAMYFEFDGEVFIQSMESC